MNPQPRSLPALTDEALAALATDHFGLRVRGVRRLPGEHALNLRLEVEGDPSEVLLRIESIGGGRTHLEAQSAALEHLARTDPGVRVPRLLAGPVPLGGRHPAPELVVRLLEFIPGTPLAELRGGWGAPGGRIAFAREVGAALGRLDRALASFDHPGVERPGFEWELRAGVEVVRDRLAAVADPGRRALLEEVVAAAAPLGPGLRTGVIHGDANDHNLLVREGAEGPRLAGLIDFGDLSRSWLVAEPAIAAAYLALDAPDPVGVVAGVVAGYQGAFLLNEAEVAAVLPLVRLRLAVSVAIAAARAPGAREANPYLAVSEAPAWRLLEALAGAGEEGRAAAARRIAAVADAHGPGAPSREGILAERRRRLGPGLSLSYREPLHIVGGWMQYLWEADGRRYLDAVNNVPHVGHQHPRVVEAVRRQAGLLNTNTRYLHGAIVELAERLAATLPEPLSVCWFVNSGSEANDLALRLARAHTGRRGVVALEGGYHGHTSALIEVSPYKFDGPGGAGAPRHVRVAPLPDPWRGRHRGHGPETGALYASEVERAARLLAEDGIPPAALICEPVLGCGGQIVPPEGFLAGAFRAIRAAGGVAIADEVQIGFGRLGTHFWGFEQQGAVPDIVTMGKPMGNGHPIAAVVTTPEIAASFDTGMEFFSTFGGNPVSCAAALAVLDVMQEEGLQAHALDTGAFLLARLGELAEGHAAIGEVRGSGLFLGIELVRDAGARGAGPDARTPAPDLASELVDRMRREGILLSTDGPDRNVIKIKPPLAFGRADAERLADGLERGLSGEG